LPPCALAVSGTPAHLPPPPVLHCRFFFNPPPPPEIYTLSLHDALPISLRGLVLEPARVARRRSRAQGDFRHPIDRRPDVDGEERSEEHTSELQSLTNLVCRLLLEKKKVCGNCPASPVPRTQRVRSPAAP